MNFERTTYKQASKSRDSQKQAEKADAKRQEFLKSASLQKQLFACCI